MSGSWMIYGANGYTGRLCARVAKARGLSPVLAGRGKQEIARLGQELGLDTRVFDLSNAGAVATSLKGIDAVLHCAGPFSATHKPMLSGCEQARCHYLDITGEIDIFESVHRNDARWKQAGIVVMPGVGFDVVPSDCLAAMLKRELPDATHLTLAFRSKRGRVSPGTAKTIAEGLPHGCRIRRDGQLVEIPSASKTLSIAFENTPELAVVIPWGDVSTAFWSTGIPNIEVYMHMPEKQIRQMRSLRFVAPLLGFGFVQSIIKSRIAKTVQGPTDSERANDETILWGKAENADGDTKVIRLRTPEGYTLTADAAVSAITCLLESPLPPGAYTPSKAFGPDFVLGLENVKKLEG
ncbi:MAG: saccharopine dehydrogenase NADP-binding domain-containing protein [Candidatus Hydrogenedentes bacterium]|nr:saccharopine dehydrogenase NADP-binding domain-containing protein [Candidatus Hydrogenedentota bacterium]